MPQSHTRYTMYIYGHLHMYSRTVPVCVCNESGRCLGIPTCTCVAPLLSWGAWGILCVLLIRESSVNKVQ